MPDAIEVNGRKYSRPARTTVVICVDGCDPQYVARGLQDGTLPTLARFRDQGLCTLAHAVMPSFTNPNNASIVTGVPPVVHGISGNYYLDRETGREIMVTDASLLRCETILGRMSLSGVAVAAVTAKDKLRKMLSHNLKGIAFSSQCAGDATLEENGIADVEGLVGRPAPDLYSSDLSLFVMDAGIALVKQGMADLLYLSLSDLVQHAHAPGEPEADAFLSALDARIASLVDLGAIVGVVADHGMGDKSRPDGSPNVIFLEDELAACCGAGSARVICPITDPFVRHHGALGSFVRVYARNGIPVADLMRAASSLPGVESVLPGDEAARLFELPSEYEGDFVVLGDAGTVIGGRADEHDLSGLAGHRLRSHGGLSEQKVPFLLSHRPSPEYLARAEQNRLRNFDLFDFVLNGVDTAMDRP